MIRNGHAAVQCNSFSAGFDSHGLLAGQRLKHGGADGVGSFGCPNQFVGVGHMCFLFPIKEPASHNEMAGGCGTGAIPYAPISLVQNAVVKGLIKVTVLNSNTKSLSINHLKLSKYDKSDQNFFIFLVDYIYWKY